MHAMRGNDALLLLSMFGPSPVDPLVPKRLSVNTSVDTITIGFVLEYRVGLLQAAVKEYPFQGQREERL